MKKLIILIEINNSDWIQMIFKKRAIIFQNIQIFNEISFV